LDYYSKWEDGYYGHYILVIGKDKRCYTICNDRKNLRAGSDIESLCSFQRVPHKKFTKLCWKYYKNYFKVVWFLRKSNKNG